MSLDQRVRAMRRGTRNSFYRNQPLYRKARMLIAQRLQIPLADVRRLLGEEAKK